jgi:hypothetical protein
MPGLVPGIYVFAPRHEKDVDRDEMRLARIS